MNAGFAVLAMALLIGFLGILIWHVPRVDLVAVVAITLVLAIFDLMKGRQGRG